MSGAAVTVSADQRYTKARPCPICGGCDRDVRGRGARCFGYRSADGTYAHCTREEQAGGLDQNDKSGAYAHRLEGPCKCGVTHGETVYESRDTHYEYKDEHSTTLFRVVRTPDKRFYQQTPDGRGGWQKGLNGARRVLYNLPELIAYPTATVYVVEGEKCVEAMRARGLLATSCPMGAKKWHFVKDESDRVLRGRRVVILTDADADGRAHGLQVAAALQGVAASVRTIELYKDDSKRDVYDWFAAGGTVEKLAELVNASETTKPEPDGCVSDSPPSNENKPTKRWKRCRELVEQILQRADDPWVSLALGGEEIASVRLGGIALLIGGTGRGKTSLTATLLVEHAQSAGPAIGMSLELTGDEWVARTVGTRCDASWAGVLRGEVPKERMLEVLPERLAIVERESASIEALRECIAEMRRDYPNEPILVAIDYVQLIGADSEDDIRPRIGKIMRQIDQLARSERVVVIALSQGSRASARALSSGEVIGAATTDAGAESADLERWASLTLAIGKHGEPGDDGSCAAELSIGKLRMGGGDRVLPARYYGKSGLWRITGESKPTAVVLAERQTERDTKKQAAAELAILQFASKSSSPVSKRDLRSKADCRAVIADAAITALVDRGELVPVHIRTRGMKRGEWPYWTPERLAASGLRVDGEGER